MDEELDEIVAIPATVKHAKRVMPDGITLKIHFFEENLNKRAADWRLPEPKFSTKIRFPIHSTAEFEKKILFFTMIF